MKFHLLLLLCTITSLAILSHSITAPARDTRQHMLPNALHVPGFQVIDDEPFACILCHVDSQGDSDRNPFGMDVEEIIEGSESTRPPFWGAFLASMDSDGDGFTNGEELQDPTGTLLQQLFGEPIDENFPRIFPVPDLVELVVGNPDLVSHPGDPNSIPPGGGGNDTPTPTPTETLPEPPTATRTPTLALEETATETPTNTTTVTETATSEPTESHTPTHTVTQTPEDSTPTPTLTDSNAATPTETVAGFDRDSNQFINARDLLILLEETLTPEEWFLMSAGWQQDE